MPLLSLLLLWLAALGPAQQPKAKVEFAARAEGSAVRAVIKLRVAPNWHLYASDLGDPNAVGLPLELRFTGEGVTWGEPRYPTPEKEKQEYGQDGTPATAAVYRGTIAIYVAGALAGTRSAGKSAKAASGPGVVTGASAANLMHWPPSSQVWPSRCTPTRDRSAPSASAPAT